MATEANSFLAMGEELMARLSEIAASLGCHDHISDISEHDSSILFFGGKRAIWIAIDPRDGFIDADCIVFGTNVKPELVDPAYWPGRVIAKSVVEIAPDCIALTRLRPTGCFGFPRILRGERFIFPTAEMWELCLNMNLQEFIDFFEESETKLLEDESD